jgi:hypothetical protein
VDDGLDVGAGPVDGGVHTALHRRLVLAGQRGQVKIEYTDVAGRHPVIVKVGGSDGKGVLARHTEGDVAAGGRQVSMLDQHAAGGHDLLPVSIIMVHLGPPVKLDSVKIIQYNLDTVKFWIGSIDVQDNVPSR